MFYLLFLLLSGSRNRYFPLLPHPNCQLQAFAAPITPAFDDTRPAVQAFARLTGAPHAVLYLRKSAGNPDRAACVLVVQRSAAHLTRYAYRDGRVDSTHLVDGRWQRFFARLGKGHYTARCESISTDPTYWVLLVKHGPAVTFSLGLTDYRAQDFTAPDQARLAPALGLVRLLAK